MKTKIITLIAILVSSSAFAQSPTPSPSPTPPIHESETVTQVVPAASLQTVLAALIAATPTLPDGTVLTYQSSMQTLRSDGQYNVTVRYQH